jgi:hypothetical protein
MYWVCDYRNLDKQSIRQNIFIFNPILLTSNHLKDCLMGDLKTSYYWAGTFTKFESRKIGPGVVPFNQITSVQSVAACAAKCTNANANGLW